MAQRQRLGTPATGRTATAPIQPGALVLTTTPAAVAHTLAAIGITPRFVFKPTPNDPFHAELHHLPPSDDPQAAIAANLVLRAITSTQPLSELLEHRAGD